MKKLVSTNGGRENAMNSSLRSTMILASTCAIALIAGYYAAWLGFRERIERHASTIESLERRSERFRSASSDHDGDGYRERWTVSVDGESWPKFEFSFYDQTQDGIPNSYSLVTGGWNQLDRQSIDRSEFRTELAERTFDEDGDGVADQRSVQIEEKDWTDVELSTFYGGDGNPRSTQLALNFLGSKTGEVILSYGATKEYPDYEFLLLLINPSDGARVMYRDLNIDGNWDMMSVEDPQKAYVWFDDAWTEATSTTIPIANSAFKYSQLESGELVAFVDGRWSIREQN